MRGCDGRGAFLLANPDQNAFLPDVFCVTTDGFFVDAPKPAGYERAMINQFTHRWHASQLGFVTGAARPYAYGGALLR
jgi:hypothetical protein